MKNNQQVAEQILEQLGGVDQLTAMIGANDFAAIENGVAFRFRGSRAFNTIKITLDQADTYTIKLMRLILGTVISDEVIFHIIYNNQLKGLIESKTGLSL